MLIQVDEIGTDLAKQLYNKIDVHPNKTASEFFPQRPIGYVKTTKLIKQYLINKIVAIDLGLQQNDTWKKYAIICANIWAELPDWARTINLVKE